MKEQPITQKLRGVIENFESICGLERVHFSKSQGSCYKIGYEYVTTKGVSSSAVYLYDLPEIERGKTPRVGISFNFFKNAHGYQDRFLPLEEQTVRFSYCLDSKKKDKEVMMTEPLYIEEAKEIIRTISSSLKGSEITSESIVKAFEEIAFKFVPNNESESIEAVEKELEKPRSKLKEIEEQATTSAESLEDATETLKTRVRESEEQKIVLELQAKLKKARENLTLKEREIRKELELDEKEKANKDSCFRLNQAEREWKKLVKDAMQKFGLTLRHYGSLVKYK